MQKSELKMFFEQTVIQWYGLKSLCSGNIIIGWIAFQNKYLVGTRNNLYEYEWRASKTPYS